MDNNTAVKSEASLEELINTSPIGEMLDSLSTSVHLPMNLIDSKGHVLYSTGQVCSYCEIFQRYLPKNITCELVHSKASSYAFELGESYIFGCHANLNHIVFPLTKSNVYLGSVLAGPFLMDQPDALLVSDLSHRYTIPSDALLELYESSSAIPVLNPSLVTQLSRLIYFLFSGLLTDAQNLLSDHKQQYLQQSLIFNALEKYKKNKTPVYSYPYEKENDLIVKVKTGNVSGAKEILNDLLGYVLFSEGNSLELIKTRAIELSTLLSRAAIEGGAASDSILKINNQFLKILQLISSQEDLCYKLQEIVVTFTEAMFTKTPSQHHELIKKAVSYISQNYAMPITLDNVADEVKLNASYFSTIFKKSIGSSFKEYLNLVRIEESKRLLTNTDYTIIDIAIAVGYEDQSYFCKVFKKYTGITPSNYR